MTQKTWNEIRDMYVKIERDSLAWEAHKIEREALAQIKADRWKGWLAFTLILASIAGFISGIFWTTQLIEDSVNSYYEGQPTHATPQPSSEFRTSDSSRRDP